MGDFFFNTMTKEQLIRRHVDFSDGIMWLLHRNLSEDRVRDFWKKNKDGYEVIHAYNELLKLNGYDVDLLKKDGMEKKLFSFQQLWVVQRFLNTGWETELNKHFSDLLKGLEKFDLITKEEHRALLKKISIYEKRPKAPTAELYIKTIEQLHISNPTLNDLKSNTLIPRATWDRYLRDAHFLSELSKAIKKKMGWRHSKTKQKKTLWNDAQANINDKIDSFVKRGDALNKRAVPYNDNIKSKSSFDDIDDAYKESIS